MSSWVSSGSTKVMEVVLPTTSREYKDAMVRPEDRGTQNCSCTQTRFSWRNWDRHQWMRIGWCSAKQCTIQSEKNGDWNARKRFVELSNMDQRKGDRMWWYWVRSLGLREGTGSYFQQKVGMACFSLGKSGDWTHAERCEDAKINRDHPWPR